MPELYAGCRQVYAGADGRKVIFMGRFENFSNVELAILYSSLAMCKICCPETPMLLKEIGTERAKRDLKSNRIETNNEE